MEKASKYSFHYKCFLAGFLTSGLTLTVLLSAFFSYEGAGVIKVRRFPPGISFVKFENQLVEISVSDFQYSREDDLHFSATCKDERKGSMEGTSLRNDFWFYYSGFGRLPINDVDGVYNDRERKNQDNHVPAPQQNN